MRLMVSNYKSLSNDSSPITDAVNYPLLCHWPLLLHILQESAASDDLLLALGHGHDPVDFIEVEAIPVDDHAYRGVYGKSDPGHEATDKVKSKRLDLVDHFADSSGNFKQFFSRSLSPFGPLRAFGCPRAQAVTLGIQPRPEHRKVRSM